MRRLIRRLSKILLLCLLVFVGGYTIIYFSRPTPQSPQTSQTPQTPPSTLSSISPKHNPDNPTPTPTKSEEPSQITDLITDGRSFFIKYVNNKDEFATTIQKLKEKKDFQAARQQAKSSGVPDYCGDPEILIGKNNYEIKDKEANAIAVVVPLESQKETQDSAKKVLRGVAQAQEKYNKEIENQKQPKKPLKIFIANEKENDNSTIRPIAPDLAKEIEILGVIGHHTSDSTEKAVPIYSSHKLVLISATSTKTIIENGNGYFFRTVPNNKASAEALVNYVLKYQAIQPKRAAIIFNSNSIFSESLKSEFATTFKEKTKIDISKNYDLKNIVSSQNLIQDSKINESQKLFSILMLAGTLNDFKQIYSSLAVTDAQKFFFLGGDTMYVPENLTTPNGDIAGRLRNIAIAISWHHTYNNPESKNFVKEASALWCLEQGKEDNYITRDMATAYDATNVLIKAINNSPNPTRETVKEALSNNFSMPGITGSIKFKDNGDLDAQSKLVKLFEYDSSAGKTYKLKLINEAGIPQS